MCCIRFVKERDIPKRITEMSLQDLLQSIHRFGLQTEYNDGKLFRVRKVKLSMDISE